MTSTCRRSVCQSSISKRSSWRARLEDVNLEEADMLDLDMLDHDTWLTPIPKKDILIVYIVDNQSCPLHPFDWSKHVTFELSSTWRERSDQREELSLKGEAQPRELDLQKLGLKELDLQISPWRARPGELDLKSSDSRAQPGGVQPKGVSLTWWNSAQVNSSWKSSAQRAHFRGLEKETQLRKAQVGGARPQGAQARGAWP